MPSPPLVLPGVLFVGEDARSRVVAHTGPAAGWFVPKGTSGWQTEVAVVAREALTEDIQTKTKLVMPEAQIPRARMPLTAQAAAASPLIAVSSKLAPKLVEAGIRVHTIGVDRVTSSFYYLAEGGGEDAVRVEGDLVAAVGAMLGERADNAAIERVLDGLVDRLVRSLSRDRVTELSVELAAALPRASADGTGMQDVELDAFEAELSKLVASSEKYSTFAKEIASKLEETNERRVDLPLYTEARKVSQGPFELAVGERKVPLGTYERWIMSQPFAEPGGKPAAAAAAAPAPRPASSPPPKAATPKPAATEDKAAAEKAAAEAKAKAEAAAKAKADAEAKAKAEAEAKAKAEAEAKAKAEAEAKAKAEAEAKAKAEAEAKAKAEAEAAEAKAKAEAEEKAKAEAEAKAKAAAEEKAKADADAKAKADAAAKAEADAKAKAKEAEKVAEKSDDAPAKKSSLADTAKIQRAPQKSNTMAIVAILVVLVAGIAIWKVFVK